MFFGCLFVCSTGPAGLGIPYNEGCTFSIFGACLRTPLPGGLALCIPPSGYLVSVDHRADSTCGGQEVALWYFLQ